VLRGRDARREAEIVRELGLPLFVKPANLGSSVAVSKVKVEGDLERALEAAFAYDTKVILEAAVDARELEEALDRPVLAERAVEHREEDVGPRDLRTVGETAEPSLVFGCGREADRRASRRLRLDVGLQQPSARLVDEHRSNVVLLQEGGGDGGRGAQADLVLARASAEEERDREALRHREEV
jgi:hypothetical protein